MAVRRPFPHRDPLPASVRLPGGRGRSLADRTEHVRAAYADWKRRFLARTADEEYRVRFGTKPDSKTVSEGQGYGMLIVAYMAGTDPDARWIFDGLYRFSRRHSSLNDAALMDWEVHFDKTRNQHDGSAFDGDADIAYALLLAARQWDPKPGGIDYAVEARRILRHMAAVTLGRDSHLPLLGDWVSPSGNGAKHNQWTWRSSDFLPAHFRAFAKTSGNGIWTDTIRRCHAHFGYLQSRFSPRTGMVPDFIVAQSSKPQNAAPAPPDFLEGAHDGEYYYNACRVPWRLGMDVLQNDAPASRAFLKRLMRWASRTVTTGKVPFAPGYRLDGTPIQPTGRSYFSAAFVAPLAVGAATGDAPQEIIDLLYDAVVTPRGSYYEDTVGLLCLIALCGAAWNPLRA